MSKKTFWHRSFKKEVFLQCLLTYNVILNVFPTIILLCVCGFFSPTSFFSPYLAPFLPSVLFSRRSRLPPIRAKDERGREGRRARSKNTFTKREEKRLERIRERGQQMQSAWKFSGVRNKFRKKNQEWANPSYGCPFIAI